MYKEEKGYFHVFAKACIHNRIKDYYRAQKRHSNVIPFSSLSAENDNGEEIAFETEHKELLDSVREKKVLPVKQVMTDLKVNQKIFERHRKYLIMGILITDGGYEILSEYFDAGDRR